MFKVNNKNTRTTSLTSRTQIIPAFPRELNRFLKVRYSPAGRPKPKPFKILSCEEDRNLSWSDRCGIRLKFMCDLKFTREIFNLIVDLLIYFV